MKSGVPDHVIQTDFIHLQPQTYPTTCEMLANSNLHIALRYHTYSSGVLCLDSVCLWCLLIIWVSSNTVRLFALRQSLVAEAYLELLIHLPPPFKCHHTWVCCPLCFGAAELHHWDWHKEIAISGRSKLVSPRGQEAGILQSGGQ